MMTAAPRRTATPMWFRELHVLEIRSWQSVLAPVYLQLLEGLVRVSEGHSGGAFCRECGRPFLTLDARRSLFCNDRERYRFTQRERRKRLKTITITEDLPGDDRLEELAEGHISEQQGGSVDQDL